MRQYLDKFTEITKKKDFSVIKQISKKREIAYRN